MTKEEIKTRFENGEIATNTFGFRKNYYGLGNDRITEKQYNFIQKEFDGRYSYTIVAAGFTKHELRFKKTTDEAGN